MGTVIAMPLAGILAEYVSWESIFYVFGKLLNLIFGLEKNLRMSSLLDRFDSAGLVCGLVGSCRGFTRPG